MGVPPTWKESSKFEILDNGQIRCTACINLCDLDPMQIGVCGIRMHREGKMYVIPRSGRPGNRIGGYSSTGGFNRLTVSNR